MPKRKRSVQDTVHARLEKHRIDIFRAVSSAKAAERKRFGARLREPGLTSEKKSRLDREHNVLKALDLRQVARNHLHANLLRIKAVEASSDLPAELRAEQPKSTLSPEEITIHNNVISQLCNTPAARLALDRAVADICETLGVPVAEKSKRLRKNKRRDAEDQPSDRIAEEHDADNENEARPARKATKAAKTTTAARGDSDDEQDEESGFKGFSSDDEDGDTRSPNGKPRGLDGSDEEAAVSKYDDLLGGSSDDEEDDFDEDFLSKYRGREQVNLDDISLSGSADEVDSEAEEEEEEEEEEARSASGSPPPQIKTLGGRTKEATSILKKEDKKDVKPKDAKPKKASKAAIKATKAGTSAFLPTLMGGYISGSESASDIDAPRTKRRRGQRARQAIWEKKYGASAKHLQKQAAKGARDAGWDMKRGAVDSADRSKGKRSKGGPPARNSRHTQSQPVEVVRKPTKKDDQGPLHPSWEARKKAKDAEKSVAFAGSKIVFD